MSIKNLVSILEGTIGQLKAIGEMVEEIDATVSAVAAKVGTVAAQAKKATKAVKKGKGTKAAPKKAAKAAPKAAPKAAKAAAKKVAKAAAKKVAKAAPKAAKPEGGAKRPYTRKPRADGKPKIQDAIVSVMGSNEMDAPSIFEALKAKDWVPASNDPKGYISFVLSSSGLFDRTRRGFYRVKGTVSPDNGTTKKAAPEKPKDREGEILDAAAGFAGG